MPTEAEKRQHRCAFTGHRPEKLSLLESFVKAELKKAICQAMTDGFHVFISGMARGVDLWAAQIVLQFRQTHPQLKLICAIPYPNFETRWPLPCREQYQDVLSRADFVLYLSPAYAPNAFRRRNEWMVCHAARLIAVYQGSAGGTRSTLAHAKRQDVSCVLISAPR